MIGPRNREGYTNLPNAEVERLFNDLRPEQLRLYIGLRVEAQFGEPVERTDKFGRAFLVGVGEVPFGIDTCAARYGMSKDQVRRAVERFEQLGLVSRRPAVLPATPPATAPGLDPATPRGREAATPPTVLRFLTDRETCWNVKEPATPRDAQPATPPATAPASAPATIQPTNPEPVNQDADAGADVSAEPARDARVVVGGKKRFSFSQEIWDLVQLLSEKIGRRLSMPRDEDVTVLEELIETHGLLVVAHCGLARLRDHPEVESIGWVAASADDWLRRACDRWVEDFAGDDSEMQRQLYEEFGMRAL